MPAVMMKRRRTAFNTAHMRSKLAIVAALPREVARLVRAVRPDPLWVKRGVWLYRLRGAVVVAAGMGAERAKVAVEAALSESDVETLVSTGLAGGCAPGLTAGSVLEASWVVDAGTGERFPTYGTPGTAPAVVLATTDSIAGVQQKAELARRFGAAMVDMEAASVARMAQSLGLRFRSIKGISDESDMEVSRLQAFAGDLGTFRTGAFALHTALHPTEWRKAVVLGRNSARALAGLEVALSGVLDGL
ncbi:MAG: phosphorylase [Acidobacteriota bacterium]